MRGVEEKNKDAVHAVVRDPRLDFKLSRLRSRRNLETNRHEGPSKVLLERMRPNYKEANAYHCRDAWT